MKKRKEKIDKIETEWLTDQYQILFDELKRIENDLQLQARDEDRSFILELAGLSRLEQHRRITEWKKQYLLGQVFYIIRYLEKISQYEILTPDIDLEAMKSALFDPVFSDVNLVSSIVDKIEDKEKAKWVKEKLDRLEAFQSMDMGTQYIQSEILEKLDGTHEVALSHGVDLDEFSSSYASKEVHRHEEMYGPLKEKITSCEASILDFIWRNAETRKPGVWRRKGRDFAYKDEEERVNYFTGYSEALEKEYDGGEDATEFVIRYLNEQRKRNH